MTADEIIDKVRDLPVVAETARKLTSQLSQPDWHRDELIETLRCDSVLTAKLLRLCNSAHCAAREPVLSLDQAVFLLGGEMIFRMVCAIGYGACLRTPAPGYDTEANGLWSHSLNTALGAEHLAKVEYYGNFPSSTAFTAGLLHDIGKIVMNKALTPKDRAEIRQKIASQSLTRIAAEKAVLGVNHCEIGFCLLKRWSLPGPILEAVANHHSPVTQPEVQLSAVVYFADCAAHLSDCAPGLDAHVVEVKSAAANVLGLDVNTVEHTLTNINGAMHLLPQLEAAA